MHAKSLQSVLQIQVVVDRLGMQNRSIDAREKSRGFDIITAAAKGSQGHAITITQDINQQYKNKITTGI